MSNPCPYCGRDPFAERPPLTPKRAAVLTFISDYLAEHGFPPSFEDIARARGYRSFATVHEHVTRLQADGYLTPSAERPHRTLVPVVLPAGPAWREPCA
jgi:SOS-response transcriptional repressor LexA